MNYRHAFHAGNFADVVKHALLARILDYLGRKPAPYRFVDTHAGIGLYDLGSDEALRSPEWRDGIGRVAEPFDPEVEALLEPWRLAVAAVRDRYGPDSYPGSPALARELMRPGDRAVLAELHPADGAELAERYRSAGAIKVLRMDGWTALGSLLPPPERRGLVLIDPPYEAPGEYARALAELARAVAKWPTGLFALWYPIKTDAPPAAPALPRPALRLELRVERARPDGRLTGTGLLVVNPPWTLREEAALLLPALAERLARGPGAGATVSEHPAA